MLDELKSAFSRSSLARAAWPASVSCIFTRAGAGDQWAFVKTAGGSSDRCAATRALAENAQRNKFGPPGAIVMAPAPSADFLASNTVNVHFLMSLDNSCSAYSRTQSSTAPCTHSDGAAASESLKSGLFKLSSDRSATPS
jgi:hypothetical protein